jgi:hypothetical protein
MTLPTGRRIVPCETPLAFPLRFAPWRAAPEPPGPSRARVTPARAHRGGVRQERGQPRRPAPGGRRGRGPSPRGVDPCHRSRTGRPAASHSRDAIAVSGSEGLVATHGWFRAVPTMLRDRAAWDVRRPRPCHRGRDSVPLPVLPPGSRGVQTGSRNSTRPREIPRRAGFPPLGTPVRRASTLPPRGHGTCVR